MPISELLPPRVPVNREVLEKLPDQELLHVAMQLYREASLRIQACAQNHAPAKLTDRSQNPARRSVYNCNVILKVRRHVDGECAGYLGESLKRA